MTPGLMLMAGVLLVLLFSALITIRLAHWVRTAVPDARRRWAVLQSCTPDETPRERCRMARSAAVDALEDARCDPPGGDLGNIGAYLALVRSRDPLTHDRIQRCAHRVREHGRALFRDGHSASSLLVDEVIPELDAITIRLEEEYLEDHPPPHA